MNRIMTILAVGLMLFAVSLQAQESKSTKRIERQHTYTQFQKSQMKSSEASLLAAMNSESVGLQQSAIQSLRDLEQLAPEYPFSTLIGPLEQKLKNEQADQTVRMLAALALDELHSDAGDAVIKSMAEKSENKSVLDLCNALLVRSNVH
jgi:hypothetical protein